MLTYISEFVMNSEMWTLIENQWYVLYIRVGRLKMIISLEQARVHAFNTESDVISHVTHIGEGLRNL